MMRPQKVVAREGERTAIVQVGADGLVSVVDQAGGGHDESTAGVKLALTYLGHGRFRVQDEEQTRLAYAVDAGDLRWVAVDGQVFLVEVSDVRARPRRRPPSGHESLSAAMPATVVRIAVSVGEVVARGTPLVILEAMKMEMPLRAPHDAVVEAIRCQEGELVQPGVPLIVLDETGTPR
jgi:3-methylcrotonyl-CoA carboxylase alpha subunit